MKETELLDCAEWANLYQDERDFWESVAKKQTRKA